MSDWVGLTVGQVLEMCGATFGEVRLVDEPPGKLRAVQFVFRAGGEARPVTLEIESRPELFSRERAWAPALVEGQRVVGVHASTEFF